MKPGYDHVHMYVGNAFQSAAWWMARFGFQPLAYRGLETGSRDVVTHVLRQNNVCLCSSSFVFLKLLFILFLFLFLSFSQIIFAFSSALDPNSAKAKEIGRELALHGDGVKDVSYAVENCRSVYEKSIERGAKSISPPQELTDEHGTVVVATIAAYADTVHTFIERRNYNGPFLPGFKKSDEHDPLVKLG
jgi:4-hydroxyphenylpyruvate dioxygenase